MPDREQLVRRLRNVPRIAPALRAERKRISKEIAALDRIQVIGLAHHLIGKGIDRFVAYELVLNHPQTIDAIVPAEVEKLGEGMNGWDEIDSFACIISGPAWRSRRIPDSLVRTWAHSSDWSWRRAALVSTVPLNSRAQGAGDAKRTFAICRCLLADRHPLIVKATSWALRELAKRDPDSVRLFLPKHADRLAPLVIREVNNKLATGRKAP